MLESSAAHVFVGSLLLTWVVSKSLFLASCDCKNLSVEAQMKAVNCTLHFVPVVEG